MARKNKPILKELMDKFGDKAAYYILFKYKPDLLQRKCETFDDLKNTYVSMKNVSQPTAESWLTDPDIQSAIVDLKKRFHTIELLNLYDEYREKSTKDAKYWAPFNDVSEQLFKENTNSNEKISKFLKNKKIVSDKDDADEEDK